MESSNRTERTSDKISPSKGFKLRNTAGVTTGGIEISELRNSLWDTESALGNLPPEERSKLESEYKRLTGRSMVNFDDSYQDRHQPLAIKSYGVGKLVRKRGSRNSQSPNKESISPDA